MMGLPESQSTPAPFVLLDAVTLCDAEGLSGWRDFAGVEMWQGMETVAQAAALHQRWLSGFSQHAFLLALEDCRFAEPLAGKLTVRVRLTGQSTLSASYEVELLSKTGDKVLLGVVRVGLTPYDAVFQRERLEPRYRELFQCLTRNGVCPCADSSNSG